MEDVTTNRINEINKLKQFPLSGRDKDIINKIEGLYIAGKASSEVLAEYLKKNLSNKEIAINFENSIEQEDKLYENENLPLVSVIIPTYGGYLPIGQTIDSVLKQNYENIEIIIMDDAGNTVTKEFILDKYKNNKKIKYFQSKTKILSGADKRKAGFKKSQGEYIVFLDHDDYYIDSNFFRRAVSFFEEYNKKGKKRKESFSAYCSNVFLYNQNEDYYEIKGLNVSGKYKGEDYLYGFQIKYDKPFSVLPSVFVKEKLLKSNILESDILSDAAVYMYACLSGNLFISDYICGAYRVGENISSNSFTFSKVIPVMEEKRHIILQAAKKYPDRNWDEWLLNQMELTLDFAEKHKGKFTIKELCNIELWGFWYCKKKFKECGKYFLARYIKYNTSYSHSENKKIERLQGYYELLNKWVAIKNRGSAIDEFLIEQGWKKVSIYGYGEIGKRLYEEIGQSQLVNVVSVIDNSYKNSDILSGISICSLSDELPIADITIITPVFAFENIKKDLNKKGITCCISIEEILNKI